VITQSDLKFVKSLSQKKFRQKYNKFIAEGDKICSELLTAGGYQISKLYCTNDWYEKHVTAYPSLSKTVTVVTERDLGRVSQLRTPNKVVMILNIPQGHDLPTDSAVGGVIYLDDVQDPGNVGTIIRIADWYGIRYVVRSAGTADFYSPKVVQSTMASFANVSLHTASLDEVSMVLPEHSIVGAVLGGHSISEHSWQAASIIVMGNESKGVTSSVADQLHHKLMLPGSDGRLADSLNVGIAAALMCQSWYSR